MAGNYQMGNESPFIDVLTVTSTELQKLLTEGIVQSVDLVDLYLAQIEKENHNGLKLNAIISVTPKNVLYELAKTLDQERAEGRIRSKLHGIPITIKDNIMTGPEFHLPTTVGTYALKNAIAKANAPVVELLLKAGAIIIGKANLSEMTGFKGFGVTTGWSALGGQTQSPYVLGGFKEGDKLLGHSTPAGSSSGSAAGVAAGFAPLTLATETDGSIVQPANRAALYGIKATVGAIPTDGTAPWSSVTDSVGGMAKSAEDLANFLQVLTGVNYTSDLTGSWVGQRVGFVDPTLWSFSPVICDADPVLLEQQRDELAAAISKIRESGAFVEQPVPLTSMDELVLDGEDALEQLWNNDFEKEWNKFLQGYENIEIKTLADMVHFNQEHAEKALPPKYPGQQLLEIAVDESRRISPEKYQEGIRILRDAAKINGIDKTLAENDLDVILGPMDGRIPTIAAAAGYPVGTMPLGFSKTNGRAFGVCIVAGAGQEGKILRVMSAWEATTGRRIPPPQLQSSSFPSAPRTKEQCDTIPEGESPSVCK